MSTKLEQFINDHRDEFDSEEPSRNVWENIREQVDPSEKKKAPVVSFNWKKLSIAAAVAVLLGAGALILNRRQQTISGSVATQPAVVKPATDNGLPKVVPADTVKEIPQLADNSATVKPEPKKQNDAPDETVANMNEEMYHFAKLVEIKHKELKQIQKDEPLLYQQFAGDVNKLDSVYHGLEKQLPQNPNREQLIEAMIQNLQLQMDLLNHQLSIIKQINNSKKSAYEKAFKSA